MSINNTIIPKIILNKFKNDSNDDLSTDLKDTKDENNPLKKNNKLSTDIKDIVEPNYESLIQDNKNDNFINNECTECTICLDSGDINILMENIETDSENFSTDTELSEIVISDIEINFDEYLKNDINISNYKRKTMGKHYFKKQLFKKFHSLKKNNKFDKNEILNSDSETDTEYKNLIKKKPKKHIQKLRSCVKNKESMNKKKDHLTIDNLFGNSIKNLNENLTDIENIDLEIKPPCSFIKDNTLKIKITEDISSIEKQQITLRNVDYFNLSDLFDSKIKNNDREYDTEQEDMLLYFAENKKLVEEFSLPKPVRTLILLHEDRNLPNVEIMPLDEMLSHFLVNLKDEYSSTEEEIFENPNEYQFNNNSYYKDGDYLNMESEQNGTYMKLSFKKDMNFNKAKINNNYLIDNEEILNSNNLNLGKHIGSNKTTDIESLYSSDNEQNEEKTNSSLLEKKPNNNNYNSKIKNDEINNIFFTFNDFSFDEMKKEMESTTCKELSKEDKDFQQRVKETTQLLTQLTTDQTLPQPKPRATKPTDTPYDKKLKPEKQVSPVRDDLLDDVEYSDNSTYSDKKKFWEDVSKESVVKRMSLHEISVTDKEIFSKKRLSVPYVETIPQPKPRNQMKPETEVDVKQFKLASVPERTTADNTEEKLMSEYRASFISPSEMKSKLPVRQKSKESSDSDSSENQKETSQEHTGYISDSGDVENYISDTEIEDRVPQIRERQLSVCVPPVASVRKTIYDRSASLPTEDLYEVSAKAIKSRKEYYEEQIKKEMIEEQLTGEVEEESSPEKKSFVLSTISNVTIPDSDTSIMNTNIQENIVPSFKDLQTTFDKFEQKSISKEKDESKRKKSEESEPKLSLASTGSEKSISFEQIIDMDINDEVLNKTYRKDSSSSKLDSMEVHVDKSELEDSEKLAEIDQDIMDLERKSTDSVQNVEMSSNINSFEPIIPESKSPKIDDNLRLEKKIDTLMSIKQSSQIIDNTVWEVPIETEDQQVLIEKVIELEPSVLKSEVVKLSEELYLDSAKMSEKIKSESQCDIEKIIIGSLHERKVDAGEAKTIAKEIIDEIEQEIKIRDIPISDSVTTEDNVTDYIKQLSDKGLDEREIELVESVLARRQRELLKISKGDTQSSMEITDEDLKYSGHEVESFAILQQQIKQLQAEKIDELPNIASKLTGEGDAHVQKDYDIKEKEKEKSFVSDLELKSFKEIKSTILEEEEISEKGKSKEQLDLNKIIEKDKRSDANQEIKLDKIESETEKVTIPNQIIVDELLNLRDNESENEQLQIEVTDDTLSKPQEFSKNLSNVLTEFIHKEKEDHEIEYPSEKLVNELVFITSEPETEVKPKSNIELSELENFLKSEKEVSSPYSVRKTFKSEIPKFIPKVKIPKKDVNKDFISSEIKSSSPQKSKIPLKKKQAGTDETPTNLELIMTKDFIEMEQHSIIDSDKQHIASTIEKAIIEDILPSKKLDSYDINEFIKMEIKEALPHPEYIRDLKQETIDVPVTESVPLKKDLTIKLEKSFDISPTKDSHIIKMEDNVNKEIFPKIIKDYKFTDNVEKYASSENEELKDNEEIQEECSEKAEFERIPYVGSNKYDSLQRHSSSDSKSSVEPDSKGSPEAVLRRTKSEFESSSSSTKPYRKSGIEIESSSGESHYHSFDIDSGKSRPCSSDVEGLIVPGSSEYESALTSQDFSIKSPISTDYQTAVSSMSSKESMKSLDSESSGHLASVEVSEHSETLVPSSSDIEGDMYDTDDLDIASHSPKQILKTKIIAETDASLDLIDEISEQEIEKHSKMKRSHEMIFQPEIISLTDSPQEDKLGTSLDEGSFISLSSTSSTTALRTIIDKFDSEALESSIISDNNFMIDSVEKSMKSTNISTSTTELQHDTQIESITITTSSVDENGIRSVNTQVISEALNETKKPTEEPKKRSHRRQESVSTFVSSDAIKNIDCIKKTQDFIARESIKTQDKKESTEKHSFEVDEAGYAFSMVAHTSPAHKTIICPILEDSDAEKFEFESKQPKFTQQISSIKDIPNIKVTQHMAPLVDKDFHYPDLELERKEKEEEEAAQKSTPETPASISSKSSEDTDQGREYILEDSEMSCKSKVDSKSEITTVIEETTKEVSEKDTGSPNSDSFEMLEKPDLIDDFVVIEEVAKEASEFDLEGKSVNIQHKTKRKVIKHDDDVEEYLVKSAPTPLTKIGDGSSSEELGFDFEDSPPQLGKKQGTTRDYVHQYDKELEANKRWIEQQFQGDQAAMMAAGYNYDMEFERGPLEDIKEEDINDFDPTSSRIGSLGSQKNSGGSLGSVKDSYSSTPDYDVLAGRKYFTRSGEHDDVSMSSLQEFESLEKAMSLENRRLHQGSQDSSSNDSFKTRYYSHKGAQGDDVSVSSLKEFEGLEMACIAAHKIEVKVKEEEAMLAQIDEGQESLISESDSLKTISTVSKKLSNESNEEDYEKRMFEIDEIIKQAQTNVERFIDLKEGDKTESLGRGDSVEEVAKVPDLEMDQLPVKSTIKIQWKETDDVMVTSTDSLDLKIEKSHHGSTDSLDQKTGADIMTTSTDSIELQDKKEKQNESQLISSDSLEFVAGAATYDQSKIHYDYTVSVSGKDDMHDQELVMDYMIESTESLDPTSSTATHATYQYETDSVFSGSFTSGGSNTMVSSTDTIDPTQRENIDLTIEGLDEYVLDKPYVTEIIEPCEDGSYSHTIHRKVELPTKVTKLTFTGTNAEEQLQKFIETFDEGENIVETEEVDSSGNIHLTRVVEKRVIVTDPDKEHDDLRKQLKDFKDRDVAYTQSKLTELTKKSTEIKDAQSDSDASLKDKEKDFSEEKVED